MASAGAFSTGLVRTALALVPASAVLAGPGLAPAQDRTEKPPTFQASRIVPASLRSGRSHEVNDRVRNDGFMNHYEVESSFGTFQANSDEELRIRVGEVYAIARLEEVSRSEQFAKGVGKAGQDVLSAATSAVTDPMETLGETAGGVKEMFSSARRSLGGESTGGVRDMVGYSRAKRRYAAAFGVDPYSTNPVLQDHLSRVSRAGYLGDFGAGTALGLASGGAGVAMSAAGHVQSLKEMVRDKSPDELRELNEQKLEAMGVESSVIDLYLGNDAFSPTTQTALVAALEELSGMEGRGEMVKVAVLAKDDDQARFRLGQARMYASYHRKVKRLRAFVPIGKRVAVAARNEAGAVVVTAPADYVALTRDLADFSIDARGTIDQAAGPAGKELWIAGGISSLAKQWFESNGWRVHAKTAKRLLPGTRLAAR